jgi:hypothetical protein
MASSFASDTTSSCRRHEMFKATDSPSDLLRQSEFLALTKEGM